MQGHPGASKMLKVLRNWTYSPDLKRRVQAYLGNRQLRIRPKLCSNPQLRPPLEQIYDCDPCSEPEDVMETDLVGKLSTSTGYMHILTACDVFFSILFCSSAQTTEHQCSRSCSLKDFCSTSIRPET